MTSGGAQQEKMRVLVVDDDPDVRDAIATLLVDQGYAVSAAANGAEALDQLAGTQHPDVIVLDLMMPTTDGYELRARQRADARIAHIPVIAMTASVQLESRLDELQVEFLLRKPFDLDVLVSMIESTTARRRRVVI